MNRLAVITGGAQGIGRALVEHFLAEGWRAAALDRDAEAVAEIAERHEAAPLLALRKGYARFTVLRAVWSRYHPPAHLRVVVKRDRSGTAQPLQTR